MISKGLYFTEDIRVLTEKKKTFMVERSGSFTYIHFDNHRLQYGPDNHGGVSGAQLSRMVRNDVEKLVEFKQTDEYFSIDPPSVYVHQQNMNSEIGQYAVQIDMRNCYWKTAYTLGIITKQTYLKGLRKKEWKVGRNAAIGSLDKKTIVTYYRNGVEVDSERYLMPRNCRYARQLVLRKVDEMAIGIINEVCNPDEFLMFVTDCFFIKQSAADKVRDYLSAHGYDYSEATILINHHFPQKKMVVWDKIEVGINEKGKKTLERVRDKFIHYTSKSII